MAKDVDLTFHPLKLNDGTFGLVGPQGPTPVLHAIASDNNTAGIPEDAEFVEVVVSYSYDSPSMSALTGPQTFGLAIQFGLFAPDDGFQGFHYAVTEQVDASVGQFHHDVVLGTFRVPVVNGRFNLAFNDIGSGPFGTNRGQLQWNYTGYWR